MVGQSAYNHAPSGNFLKDDEARSGPRSRTCKRVVVSSAVIGEIVEMLKMLQGNLINILQHSLSSPTE